ncbi:ribonucleoside-diphosphate reductase large subunit [Rhizobium phage RHEph10]|uniref:ribonucleoside-diphosphate reductase large subunit n=1 Tax=Rhizobium phage RHEph10 TaxID=1220717 RepID=UPI0002AB42E0|nr:ribonucleoside-diphosphate reductase large subunit [Rhizobium phage RHEph10]AGC36115.1 putative ribonucleoside-diphosphate reductase protein, alpha subunit [Rhizobium phage RHEph10]
MRNDYAWLNQVALTTLSRGYLREGIAPENLKDEAIARINAIVDRAEEILGFELPTLRYGIKRGWVSPASPIWSNFGAGRGLPISCNGSYMADNMDSILFKNAEIGMMTKEGAGTSVYMGALRAFGKPISGGGRSEGPTHFARLPQEQVTVVSQGNTRRGNAAVYIDIEHEDADRWLDMRSISGGVHHPIQHLSFGLVIGDDWMNAMLAEEKGGPKRKLMAKIRNKRRETGFPYLIFRDNANNARPDVLKRLGLLIYASNLCTEIMLPSGPDESFVCDLSSVNLLYYDEWKGTPFVREMIYLLDAVMSEYIEKIKGVRLLADALRFAERWRALGLGVLGWHSLLQSQMIAIESDEARALNIEISEYIATESHAASRDLAERLGEPSGLKGTGYRNLTVNAIAPTTSSSIICGQVSQQREPWTANIFENDNAKGVFTQRNVFLEELLESKGRNDQQTWLSILQNAGSVQHLDFLTQHERNVFKTFAEIDQAELIRQTADCQKFIDQGISHNIILPPDATMKEDIDLIVLAWKSGLKSLYYRKGLNKAQELARQNASCVACEA